MRRLYLQIYGTALVILLVFWVLIASFLYFFEPRSRDTRLFDGLARVVPELIGPRERSHEEQSRDLERLAESFSVELALFDEMGRPIASTERGLPRPDLEKGESSWMLHSRGGPTASLLLEDGRWLVLRHGHRAGAGVFLVMVLALAVAIGSYPLIRRLTRRLERLQERVESLGHGDLGVRVEVEGRDEIASLARSFNVTASRLEVLVDSQRQILAGASHELRSPLTRMRVAVELGEREVLREQISREITLLDELIEELLLASRLDAGQDLEIVETLDLLAIGAEEAARFDLEVKGESVEIEAESRLIRRLYRNLIENAFRYGGGEEVEVEVRRRGGEAVVRVSDQGAGVPAEHVERIFEPFYRAPGHAETSDGGVGLGLALVRRIARRYGGEVTLEASSGQGSTFEVGFPIRPGLNRNT